MNPSHEKDLAKQKAIARYWVGRILRSGRTDRHRISLRGALWLTQDEVLKVCDRFDGRIRPTKSWLYTLIATRVWSVKNRIARRLGEFAHRLMHKQKG